MIDYLIKERGSLLRGVFKRLKASSFIAIFSSFSFILLAGYQTVSATTYNELMKRAAGDGKPAQMKTEEETPVMVSYEIGDTSSFYTDEKQAKYSDEEEDSEWDDWDSEGY